MMPQQVLVVELYRALCAHDVLLRVYERMSEELLDAIELSARALLGRAFVDRSQRMSLQFVPGERLYRLEEYPALDAFVAVEYRVLFFVLDYVLLRFIGFLVVGFCCRCCLRWRFGRCLLRFLWRGDPALVGSHMTFHLFAVEEPFFAHWTVD